MTRHAPITDADLPRLAQLYADGLSLSTLASRFHTSASNLSAKLKAYGVRIRSKGEGKRLDVAEARFLG